MYFLSTNLFLLKQITLKVIHAIKKKKCIGIQIILAVIWIKIIVLGLYKKLVY